MTIPPVTITTSGLAPDLAEQVATRWDAFLDRCKAQDLPVPGPILETLPKVWGMSEFVAKTCVSHPTLLADLVASNDLFRPYEHGELTVRLNALDTGSEQELMQQLRRARLREAVRIAWRDLAGWADLAEVMETMSDLADGCVSVALRHVYRWSCERRGTPSAGDGGEPIQMIVLGLGKLGGRELNFSSDIDLIFAYPAAGETNHPRPVSNHEFFLKQARDLIRVLTHPTEDGLVFRVDMRLRPNGDSGPLALSFDAMEQYYQTHGRDWERYALIKARCIAGDTQSGRELLAKLHPFVYRRYLDYGAFDAVRSMKAMINKELNRKGVQNNVKLGQGGIREIEFIAQSFQLIRGGRDQLLQTNQLLPALRHLGESGILSKEEVDELVTGYEFLRNLEHRLQMLRDQQTHRLPESELDRERLALATGHTDWGHLYSSIEQTCNNVHRSFEQIFVPVGHSEQISQDEIVDLWQGLLDSAIAHKALHKLGYEDTAAAINEIRALRSGRPYQAHSKYGRERLDSLMPMMIREAGQSSDPNETLRRLIRFIEGVGRRSAYLVLLIENPLALSQLVKLIGVSQWIGSWISLHPLLLDELLDPITASVASSRGNIVEELGQRLSVVADDDLEQQMDILREVRHGQSLRIAAADVSGLFDWVEVGHRLSKIAEVTLERTVQLCTSFLSSRFGAPSPADGYDSPMLGVVAYGKLGGLELGYHSDLDIVFLHDGALVHGSTGGGERSIDNEQFYGRLVQRLVHTVTTRTPAGVLYELDMRLRPSGRSGPVITSLDGFLNYQLHNAWTWEHQALVRARMIIGPEPLRERFAGIRREVLCQDRDGNELLEEIRSMRKKMRTAHDSSSELAFDLKHGPGGIVDIEFIVQYYILLRAHQHPELVCSTDNLGLIAALRKTGVISEEDATALSDAYYAYLGMEHHCKLAERPSTIGPSDLAEHRDRMQLLWKRVFD